VTGRPLRDARIDFQGVTQDTGLTGAVSGEAFLDGFRVALSGDIDNNPERLIVSDLLFEAPGATLRGDITRTSAGLIEGQLALDASNIETAAALALLEASGSANAQVVLSHDDDIQSAQITAALTNFVVEDARIGSANLTADIDDLFGVPSIDGALNGSDISAAGVRVETVTLRASRNGETTRFDGRASLAGNTSIALAGGLSPLEGDGYRVALDSFSLTQNQIAARLASPTALTVSGDTVAFDGVQLDVGSGRIVATGSAGENLDIALNITALPLSIANAVVPDLALAGTISGTAQVSGTASDPRAQFSIEGSGLNAAAISEFGVAPISLSAQGTYANEQIALSSLSASGAQGLNATARGTIPLSGGGLSLNVDGSVPLTLANRFLAERGAQAIGTLTLNATVTGSTDDPQFGGTLSVSGAEYIDPELNLRLQNISGSASLSATNATINSLSAQLATGGSISVSGSVGLDAPAFTSNLQIALNDARYADGTLLVATLAGNLALTGPVGQGGQLSGNILVQRADITVPESLGGGATLIEVDHRNPPPSVAATLARAGADARATTQRQAQTPLALNLTISAPNQIFIRGRGLDAEVGGQVQLGGTVDNIQPVGGFELIRGRLSILGQRIDFDSGTVTLIGDTDPFINLVARTEGEGITVFVTVSGRASAPDISFSSEPMLPQDEVLARLLFNRGVGELSPIQLAQLAAAAAELVGGGGNTSLLDSFRQAAGLDDLDIVSDEEGNVGVRAGRYIQDNVYLGVEAGGAGNGRVTIDLDITDNLRARGAAGSDGNTSIGIFYEQDY
jgi:translocation and assembly module TamB